ncbi:DsbA family protein [Candidatus Persebacteraceae bacterium Df01]|jgi:protein-disulfide isomerase|uniref:DsbA family protein n=1 Tax=Candidatus Doriopsillibacter californiensis TaxID=2970740 RepID=A0ABT7QMK2_9GAMM|nr:DsbA family protein [Candidatus Persebacteraceae bacterium Df01]
MKHLIVIPTFILAIALTADTFVANADDELSLRQERAFQELFDAFADGAGSESLLHLRYAFDEKLITTVINSLSIHDNTPMLGKTGPLLVEFSDYQCGYCKRMYSTLQEKIEAGRARVLVLEFPILGELSDTAARYALAAQKQQKYVAFHDALMRQHGAITTNNLNKVATAVGLDLTQLQADISSEEIDQELKKNYRLALLLNIRATPSFVINNTIVRGALQQEELQRLLEGQ